MKEKLAKKKMYFFLGVGFGFDFWFETGFLYITLAVLELTV